MRFWFVLSLWVFLSSVISSAGADFGTNEKIGTDLYRRIDEWSFSLKTEMVAKRLEGSAKKMNDLITPRPPVFDPSNDFTIDEIEEIKRGWLGPLFSHVIIPDSGVIMNTDELKKLADLLVEHYAKIQDGATAEQRDLRLVGSLGLFTDGNEKNSWYDLMTDLEEINGVIFAQDIPYKWKNLGTIDLMNIFSRDKSQYHGGDDAAASSWSAPSVLLPVVSRTGILCENSGSLHLDDSLIRDLNDTTRWSTLRNTTSPRWGPAEGYDSFWCGGLFCINIEFVMYKQNLLGGGKTNCIEGVVDKNLKIVNEYASKSFIQSNMERNFFEMPFSSFLNLPNLLSMGVIVSSLPPPILNLEPKKAIATRYDTYKQEALKESMKHWGIVDIEGDGSFSRFNDISSDCLDYSIVNLVDQSTEQSTQEGRKSPNTKCQPPRDLFGDYFSLKVASLRGEYADSFSKDLLELKTFTSSFSDRVDQITAIVSKINQKPAY